MIPGRISEDGKAITCSRCGMTSHNPNDVAQRYCGNCRVFLADVMYPDRELTDAEIAVLRRRWEEMTRGPEGRK